MSLGFPRQLFMDMYLNGWTDITEWVRMVYPVTAKQGKADEQAEPSSFLTAVLDNSDGRWVFNNPLGAYHGILRPSLGVRWGFWLARDTFNRTVSNGWGTMDSEDVWTSQGTASNFAVTPGAATHSVASAGTFVSSRSGAPVRNVYVKVDYTPGFTNVTGGPIEPANIMFRWVDADNWYLVRVRVRETDEAYTVEVLRSSTALGEVSINPYGGFNVVSGITHTSGQKVSIAAAIEERSILVKVWLASNPEPDTWNLITQDLDPEDTLTAAGQWGVRSGIDSLNTNALPMTFTYSGIVVKNIRASGELSELIPEWDESHTNKIARLRADGVLRRLRQNDPPVRSTLRRGLDNADGVVAYWPCEDEAQGATSISSGKDGVDPLAYLGDGPLFASNTDFPCSKPIPVLRGNMWFGDIPTAPATGDICFQFLASVPAAGTDDARVLGAIFTTGTVRYWDVLYFASAGGSIAVRGYNTAGTLVADSGVVAFAINGAPCRIQLSLGQSGANISCRVAVYKPLISNWTFFDFSSATQTLGAPVHVNMNSNSVHTNVAIGHITVYNINVDLFQLADETKAYVNELITARWRRLGTENKIPTMFSGAHAGFYASTRIGPQRPATLRSLFAQCVATGQAFMFEARSTVALGYRALETMWTQEPLVELDYEGDQIMAPLTPAPDDQGRRNDILAKRTEGGEFRSTQTTGPNNVNPPSEDVQGVGLYEAQLDPSPNVMTAELLRDVADFALVVGTSPDARYSQIPLQLSSEGFTEAQTLSALDVGAGDRVVVNNLTDADIYAPIDQLVIGTEEVWSEDTVHTITYNTTPAGPYYVLTLDTEDGRLDGTVVLAEDLDTTETAIDVTTVGAELTTDAGDHPYRCTINGEEVIVTACSGAGTSFTLTVTRGVNGAAREHNAGDAVLLSPQVYLGRRGY